MNITRYFHLSLNVPVTRKKFVIILLHSMSLRLINSEVFQMYISYIGNQFFMYFDYVLNMHLCTCFYSNMMNNIKTFTMCLSLVVWKGGLLEIIRTLLFFVLHVK